MPPSPGLTTALRHDVLVLDGGLSNQLRAQGCDLSGDLWSARLLADAPEQVRAAHTAYARAGARILTTASYQATYPGLARRGVGSAEAGALLRRSVSLARQAAATAGRASETWVAASVGPYGAMLADGSEYRGRYGLTVAELERFHRPRVETLAAAEPDVLALETIPDLLEAEALLRATRDCGVPVWLSFSVRGDRTAAGQPLEQAVSLAAGEEQVLAVGVNCCTPADAEQAVPVAASVGKPVVVYPNSGEAWDDHGADWVGPPTFDPVAAARWARAGARLIGGCCQVGPGRIAALADAVADHRLR